jgi:subtilisin family serine protease
VPGQVPICCCPCDDKRPRTPEKPGVSPRDYSGFLIVRVAPGVEPLTVNSLWELAEAAGLDGLRSVLELPLEEELPEESPAATAGLDVLRSVLELALERELPGLAQGPAEASPAGERAEGERAERGRRRDGERRARMGGLLKRLWRTKWREETEEERPPEPEGALVSRPLIQLRERDRKSTVWALQQTEDLASRTSFRPRHSLARYWRVDLRPYSELVDEVLARFNELAEVDLAYRELRAIDTAHDTMTSGTDLAEDQGYFDPAPVGIGAGWVKRHLGGVTRPHLKVIDLEQGWHYQHQDLTQNVPQNPDDLFVHGENRDDDEPGAGNHGTAVLGQLAAAGVGTLAVRGSAATIAEFQLASHYRRRLRAQERPSLENPFPGTNGHVASAIVNCLIGLPQDPSPLGRGDVLLLEIQRGRLPTEIDEADFDAIRLATALGIIVVEAAGNGNFNLDACIDPQTGRTLRRGAPGFVDSGAILVGASFSAVPHDRAPFSNYGSRVDCYGWGEGVTTCGYGDLHEGSGREQYYTNTFNGTSSAAPIIAGAAALLQCLHLIRTTGRLLPVPMRALLASRATGTPQGPNVGGHIGVMPNLDAVTRGSLQLVPDVYIRRHPCDEGSPLGSRDEISSSPDIVVFGTALANPKADLGDASWSAHHPSPGETRIAAGSLYVRLRNRGLAPGRAEVQLYASPAATLISPERWAPVGPATVDPVSPGDTLQVSGAVAWKPGTFASPTLPLPPPDPPEAAWPPNAVRAYSFLAVFDRDGEPLDPHRALPPGEPYFDWRRYREFLRGPGVAWRNVHPTAPGTAASLAFFLAGTTDRAREFDLEVIQRLPEGATVSLHLPQGLAAKLLQRQPGLRPPQSADPGEVSLPQRRSTRFSRVRLPERLCAPARFEVTAASGHDLAEGHSLAIRQLWRGEEVGRITWYVTAGAP